MVKIYRTIPFDYYQTSFTNSSNNKLTSKVSHYAKELFQNMAYFLANALILAANTLHIYRITKIEVPPPQERHPFYEFGPALSASAFLLSKVASSTLGVGAISSKLMSFTKILHLGNSSKNIQSKAARVAVAFYQFLLSENSLFKLPFLPNNPLFKVSFNLWLSYSSIHMAYQGLKICHDQAHRDPIGAAKGGAIHVLNIIAAISIFNQTFRSISA